ncbi:MAG: M16 family metallopeptidase [Brevinematia bacterium]
MKRIILYLSFILLFLKGAFSMDLSNIISTINSNRVDFSLKNGLKVVILNLPAESVNILLGIESGVLDEEKEGVANLTAEALLFKNKKHGFMGIVNSIESIGGSIDSSASYDFSTISAKCLSSDIYEVLDKILDTIIYFEVDDNVLNLIKPQIIASVKVREDDPWELAKKVFLKEIYGDHPYGRDIEGSIENIDKVQTKDIENFFNSFYTPDNGVLIIVGGVELEKVKRYVEEKFSQWNGKKKSIQKQFNFNLNPKKEIIVKKNLKQSTIRIGHISTNIRDENRIKLRILNFILGGSGFGSRLMDKIREKEGLAYGVFSNFYIDRKLNGYFFVGTQTENKNTKKVIEIFTNEINELINKGITEKELDDAKNYFLGALPLSIESFSSIATSILYEKVYNLERNFFIKDIEKVSVIKKEEIDKVTKEYIKPENFTFTVVGGD